MREEGFWTALLESWYALAPWLIVGALIAALLRIYLSERFVSERLRGRRGVLTATLIGIPLPLCSCGVIPAAAGLRARGASRGATLSFLISTPQTGVDSIAVTYGLLGLPFTLLKVLTALVAGLVGGFSLEAGKGATDSEGGPHSEEANAQGEPEIEERGVRATLRAAEETLAPLWGWILFGLIVSALISHWLPPTALVPIAALGSPAAIGAALLLSLPLYVCATASVPIAAALVSKGLPPEAALVFLLAGPATNLATIGAVRRVLGNRALLVYLGVLALGSSIVAYFCAGLLSLERLNSDVAAHPHEMGPDLLAYIGALTAALACLRWGRAQLKQWWVQRCLARRRPQRFAVSGLSCVGCARGLEAKLSAAAAIIEVSVDKGRDEALIVSGLSAEVIEGLIEEAGYSARALDTAHSPSP